MTRYDNLDAVKELGDKPSELRKRTATVLGMGALGSSVAETLARMGVSLRIIDKDRVQEDDLDKLSLFSEEHASKFKAKEAKKLLEGINKDIKVKAFHEELMKNNAYLVESDVIIDCSGDIDTTLLADEARKKTPMVIARAAGVEGGVLILDSTGARDVRSFLEKQLPEDDSVLPTTVRMVSALAVNKALKALSGQRYEKSLLKVNAWKFSFEKVPVRKR